MPWRLWLLGPSARRSLGAGSPDGIDWNERHGREKLHHAASAEIDHDFVVLHAVAALHLAKASQRAIVTIAHPSQLAGLEPTP